MKPNTIYLPIEFSHRELYSKSLIAAKLVAKGFRVVIGQQWAMHANLTKLPRGVILFKSYHKTYWPIMSAAKKAGHIVTSLEEELFGTNTYEGVRPVVNYGLNDLIDYIYLNSPIEKKVLSDYEYHNVVESGNPRGDILKLRYRDLYKDQVDKIKNKYGSFVLVNTNFGVTNSIWGSVKAAADAAIQSGVLDLKNERSVIHFREAVRYEKDSRVEIFSLIEQLKKIKIFDRVIVRPHPNENLEMWSSKFRDDNFVEVIREGSHIPWTIGSDLLVHCGCTTGFEAALADIPVVSLYPGAPNSYADSLVSNNVNCTFQSADELAEFLVNFNKNKSLLKNRGLYEQFYASSDVTFAADIIVEHIASLCSLEGEFEKLKFNNVAPVKQLKQKCDVEPIRFLEDLNTIAKIEGLRDGFLEKLDQSIFVLYQKNGVPNYQNTPVVYDIKEDDINFNLKKLLNIKSTNEFDSFFSTYRDVARKIPNANRLAAYNSCVKKNYEEAHSYIDQAANLYKDFNPIIYQDRAFIYHESGNVELASRFAKEYFQYSKDFNSFIFMKKFHKNKRIIVALGDSHTRFFRAVQRKNIVSTDNECFIEALECGGASAFGLLNKNSQSGLAANFDGIYKSRLKHADNIVLHFGEIDCRRASWVAARDNDLSIEESIQSSTRNYQDFILHNLRFDFSRLVIFGPKPPLVDYAELAKITMYDPRSVAVTLSQRRKVTKQFNEEMESFCLKNDIKFISIQKEYGDYCDSDDFQREGLKFCFADDIHGNIDFFAKLYEQVLIKNGLYS